jgi:hypothetical protein
MVCHAGSDRGLIEGALWAFQSKKTRDNSEEFAAAGYTTWFQEKLPPNVSTGSTTVTDTFQHTGLDRNNELAAGSRDKSVPL